MPGWAVRGLGPTRVCRWAAGGPFPAAPHPHGDGFKQAGAVCHADQTVFVCQVLSAGQVEREREKEGMTWAYVVTLGLDGFNWQPDLLRTQICISPSLCSIGSQGSSG